VLLLLRHHELKSGSKLEDFGLHVEMVSHLCLLLYKGITSSLEFVCLKLECKTVFTFYTVKNTTRMNVKPTKNVHLLYRFFVT
jgi:hypothetical protein